MTIDSSMWWRVTHTLAGLRARPSIEQRRATSPRQDADVQDVGDDHAVDHAVHVLGDRRHQGLRVLHAGGCTAGIYSSIYIAAPLTEIIDKKIFRQTVKKKRRVVRRKKEAESVGAPA